MTEYFEFEADFVNSLRCIPMQVRYKLDICGVKLKLSDWNHMTQEERETLVELPCSTATEIQAYHEYLQNLVVQHTGQQAAELPVEPHPAWLNATNIPASVEEKATELGIALKLEQWEALSPLQRFALIKLSRSGHENKNFPKAMAEFNLV
jgi:hypothetical protein